MKNQRGGIKIITLIIIILIMIAVLIVILTLRNIVTRNREASRGNSGIMDRYTNTSSTNEIENIVISNEKEEEQPLEFTYSFLNMENNKKNMVYSPLSIKYALNMLKEGANSNTYNQIDNVIGSLNLPQYSNVGNKLALANGLFIKNTYYPMVNQTYIDTLRSKYSAEIVEDEFTSAWNVNRWIDNNTLGIIKNMLNDEMFTNQSQDEQLVMLLVNALAINMEWDEEFDENDTNGDTFYLIDGKKQQATMMSRECDSNKVSYYLGDDVTALTMDLEEYRGTNLEFMAIMPESNLNEYVKSVTNQEIAEIDNNLVIASSTDNGVHIKIPKFSFEYDLRLKEDLQTLGIKDAFSKQSADFSKITGSRSLYVSDALHRTNIDFTEKGVKAAAVTVFATSITSIEERTYPIEVTIDKPFLFLIRDKDTKEVWFTGTVYEPNSWENDKANYEPQW